MEDDPIITINDIRLAGHCTAGARSWFALHPELDFRDFLKNGARASVLLAVDDGLALQVIERKRSRENG